MNKIAILDVDSLIFTAFHPNKVLDSDGNPLRENNKFVYEEKTEKQIEESVDSLMHNILSNGQFTHYIGFVKGTNTTGDRTAVNSLYKANRSTEQPKFWEFTKQYFINKWKVRVVDHLEVDDAVNITRLNLADSFITAIDKDLLYLEGINYDWKKNEWITIDKQQAEFKFWSDMICGQIGDNLQGLRGKGPKYVEELFKPVLAHPNLHIMINLPKHHLVLDAYIDHYKDFNLGLDEFIKTYKCLKIKEKHEGFAIPEPIEYKGRMS